MPKKKSSSSPKPLRLDLGCGDNKAPGFIGVDIARTKSVDVVHDLTKTPWPWKDGTVSEVVCNHFLEHLNGTQRMAFMNELYRVMEMGAKATITTPYYNSMRAVQDPTHQWPPIADSSYLYFNKGWREGQKLTHYPITANFGFTYGYNLGDEWAQRAEDARAFAFRHYTNVILDLVVVLTKE